MNKYLFELRFTTHGPIHEPSSFDINFTRYEYKKKAYDDSFPFRAEKVKNWVVTPFGYEKQYDGRKLSFPRDMNKETMEKLKVYVDSFFACNQSMS